VFFSEEQKIECNRSFEAQKAVAVFEEQKRASQK
jgi:hypothetical protein